MKKSLTAYVNGRFLPLDDASIHIEDRGFQFADGVYEVIACFGGAFLDIEPHLQRLQHSCEAIRIPLPVTLPELESLVQQTYEKNPFTNAMAYIQVTRGIAPRSHQVSESMTPSLIITIRDLPMPSDEKLTEGVSAITLKDFRWGRCDIKSIALLASVMGKQEAAANCVDETFWIDGEGHLLEGCSTNVFALINGTLVTHPLDHRILGGITRKMVIRVAEKAAVNVEERPWKLTESGLSECMMSSTTSALLPVCRINGEPVGSGKPGPATKRLRAMIIDELEALRGV
ncbi:MAG: aminotransferase class IV [Mariprofundaceae bacterium]|nr:aminotransferase class IV [Mariprofundaceae bacterium]